jgi:tRNA(Arg) A34 adenosine deaminase TadA
MLLHMTDNELMRAALKLAEQAMTVGEVPIAAIIVRENKIIGWGWNELNAKRDQTMHAEIAAFRDAAGRYPVDATDLILVSTLEPCVMCYGAALLSGVSRIVYAVSAPADGGMKRVKPPESPDTQVPKVTGGVQRDAALRLFKRWMEAHPQADSQRDYVSQLLKLNGQ